MKTTLDQLNPGSSTSCGCGGGPAACSCNNQTGLCQPPPGLPWFQRYTVPVIVTSNPNDKVQVAGRNLFANVPYHVFLNLMAHCSIRNPIQPMSKSGTKLVGEDLEVSFDISDIVDGGPGALIPGFVIDFSTADNIPVGPIAFNIEGTFEDGAAWTQQVKLTPGTRNSITRLLVLGSRITNGSTYLSPFVIGSLAQVFRVGDEQVLVDGTAPDAGAFSIIGGSAADAATTLKGPSAANPFSLKITPSKNILTTPQTFSVFTTQAGTGTLVTVDPLVPDTDLWRWMENMASACVAGRFNNGGYHLEVP